MKFDIMTLFPDMVSAVLGESIIGRAQEAGVISVACHNIRDYSTDRHRKTDDTPYGGGRGMVMTCQPIYDCYSHIRASIPEGNRTRVIYMSPKGRLFDHGIATELACYDNIVILCGHYEGVDQRILDEIVDDEISIGDYVLTGGELPACILVDAVSRLIEGTLPEAVCHEDESVASGILEYPQYTKPRTFMGREVPEVLLSGDHARVDRWRLEESVRITRERRPDLLLLHPEYEEALAPKKKKPRRKKAHNPDPLTPEVKDGRGLDAREGDVSAIPTPTDPAVSLNAADTPTDPATSVSAADIPVDPAASVSVADTADTPV